MLHMYKQKYVYCTTYIHAKVCNFHKIDILTRKLLQLDLRSLLEGKWEVENFSQLFTKLLQRSQNFSTTFTKLSKALQNFYKTFYSLIQDPKHNFICVLCVTDAYQILS